jgi:hypothetical protein
MNLKTLSTFTRVESKVIEDLISRMGKLTRQDSLTAWLINLPKVEPDLAEYFELPRSSKLGKAMETILETNSLLTIPFLHLIATKLAVYLANIADIARHPVASPSLRDAGKTLAPLRRLLAPYVDEKPRNIADTFLALNQQRIESVLDPWNNSALRAILQTLYVDRGREESREKRALLEFILKQLEAERAMAGRIPEPRHAWWAIETLLREGNNEFVEQNRPVINKTILHLLKLGDYSPRQDLVSASIAPELHTRETEELWIGVNIARILKAAGLLKLPKGTAKQLNGRLSEIVRFYLKPAQQKSFKFATIRLLLAQEALLSFTLADSELFESQEILDLSSQKVGSSLWDDEVVTQVNEMLKIAKRYLEERSRWTRPTLTSGVLCGLAGQGKSEMLRQLSNELSKLGTSLGKNVSVHSLSVGREINTNSDLVGILSKLAAARDGASCVRVLIFDEIDKAGFDFSAPFLSVLESSCEASDIPVSFWIFAQSTYPEFQEYTAYASRLSTKSLRDFLTRLQWGAIEMPDIRVAPRQRLMTALSIALSLHTQARKVTSRWCRFFSTNWELENARALGSLVNSVTECGPELCLDLSSTAINGFRAQYEFLKSTQPHAIAIKM